MKNSILFFFLLLFSFSCSKSDTPTFEEKILGEWQINSFVINSCPEASDNFPMTTSDGDGCINMQGGMNCMSISFLADKRAEIHNQESNSAAEVQTMTYEINEADNTISLCDGDDEEDCVIFSLEGDGLFNEMDESGCICIFGFKKS